MLELEDFEGRETAAISEIRAMADYNIVVARYEQATGTTLARHGHHATRIITRGGKPRAAEHW